MPDPIRGAQRVLYIADLMINALDEIIDNESANDIPSWEPRHALDFLRKVDEQRIKRYLLAGDKEALVAEASLAMMGVGEQEIGPTLLLFTELINELPRGSLSSTWIEKLERLKRFFEKFSEVAESAEDERMRRGHAQLDHNE